MILVGDKVWLTSTKYCTVIKKCSNTSYVVFYRGKEGESYRFVTADEIYNRKIEFMLFDKEITSYEPVLYSKQKHKPQKKV